MYNKITHRDLKHSTAEQNIYATDFGHTDRRLVKNSIFSTLFVTILHFGLVEPE